MAVRNPLVLVSGVPAELPSGDTTTGGGGPSLTAVEINLGSKPLRNGKLTITSAGLTVGKPVSVGQAVGPYTGKGTRADEAEMDQVRVAASVTSTTQITGYWASPHKVRGNFKFNYFVGA